MRKLAMKKQINESHGRFVEILMHLKITKSPPSGIGIDDMFVISQCWKNMANDPEIKSLSLPDKMGRTLQHAGVSITITTLTDILAFGVGGFGVSRYSLRFLEISFFF